MAFLKTILNKKTIFFFALFALFIFFPFEKAEAYCGDGILEVISGEICDGNALGSGSCPIGGTLYCTASCTGYATGQCTTCGNNTINGTSKFYLTVGSGRPNFYSSTPGGAWTALSPVPIGVGMGSGMINNQKENSIYLLPGGGSNKFYMYSIPESTWATLPSPAYPMDRGGKMIRKDGEDWIYVMTGNATSGSGNRYFARYSISGKNWTQLTSLPEAPWDGSSMFRSGQYIYMIPGNGSTGFYRYNTANNTWSNLNSIPGPINLGGQALHNESEDFIYVAQGNDQNGFYKYSISGLAWTPLNSVPSKVFVGSQMIRNGSDDQIYLTVGSGTGGADSWQKFYRYNIFANSWDTLPNTPGQISWGSIMLRNGSDNTIYLSQGNDLYGFYSYSISGNAWTNPNPTSVPTTVYYGSQMIRTEPETCDGTNFNGLSCSTPPYTFGGGNLTCNSTCSAISTLSCSSPICGDNTVNPAELCDGSDLNNYSCNNYNNYKVSGISAGYKNACVSLANGAVYCWGNNTYGQLGDGTNTDRATPVQVKGVGGVGTLTKVLGISSSAGQSCAYTTTGAAYCWGENQFGELGDGTVVPKNTPVQVKGVNGVGVLANVAGISTGGANAGMNGTYGVSCTYTTTGSAYCWGWNPFGQLGDNTYIDKTTPIQVKGVGGVGVLANVAGISVGNSQVCAFTTITDGGKVYCWGVNNSGEMGDGTTTAKPFPVQVLGSGGVGATLSNIIGIVAGEYSTCALTAGGNVYCWGIGGQLGDNTVTQSSIPVQVKGVGGSGTLGNIAGLSKNGAGQTCAFSTLATGGKAYCWGQNYSGQLGDGTTIARLAPVQVLGVGGVGTLANVIGISTNRYQIGSTGTVASTCAFTNDGNAYCWGNYVSGSTPVKVIFPTQQTFTDGTLACNANCSVFDTSLCTSCGNNIKDGTEGCDGADFGTTTSCTSPGVPGGFTGGTLGCNQSNCTLITSSCFKCGDNTANPGETCDGSDVKGKTCITEGFDGPVAPTALTCNAGCGSFNTTLCYKCGDSVIYPGAESCDTLNLGLPAATCSSITPTGTFNRGDLSCSNCAFNTTLCYKCGDGIKTLGLETCDDGNIIDNPIDGCDSTCHTNAGYTCTGNNPSICRLTCGNGIIDRGAGETCDQGAADYPPESNDGCSSTCQQEANWTCLPAAPAISPQSSCTENCGNSAVDAGETCDHGTTSPNKTIPCSINGYTGSQNCINSGVNACTYAVCSVVDKCGDGKLNGPETGAGGCDDGNTSTTIDGCSGTCRTDPGYTCSNPNGPNNLSTCELNCRNNKKEVEETCDPTHSGTAKINCTTTAGYPGTQDCNNTCLSYGTCTSPLICGDSIITNPPETCDKNTRSCITGVGEYAGTQICATSCNSYDTCLSLQECGDGIKNGNEKCDYDDGPGCAADCTVEPGYFCSGIEPNVCVFSCGNEFTESSRDEECDAGTAGKFKTTASGPTTEPTTAPYNGEKCTISAYGIPCDWCSLDCKNKTEYGEWCGDGFKNGPEECDDGNFNNGDGCSACEDGGASYSIAGCADGCKQEFGFVCTSTGCATQCGDSVCANIPTENCANCPADCGPCAIGQRPGVSSAHDKGVVFSLFDKIKTFIVQPRLLIQIPGLDLGQNKITEEYISPPPPVKGTYEKNVPTMVKIGDEYYTITVQTIGDDGTINFIVE